MSETHEDYMRRLQRVEAKLRRDGQASLEEIKKKRADLEARLKAIQERCKK